MDAEGLWGDRANLPCALILPAGDNEPLSMDLSSWIERLDVTLAVSLAGGLTRGQRALDELHDLVVAALTGGLTASLLSIRRQTYGVIEIDGVEYLGAVFRLEMIG